MKNLKRLFSLLLIAALLTTFPVALAEERSTMDKEPYADALYHLGLFKGTDKGYELEAPLTREQAITMVVRFLGKEAYALAQNIPHPFTDAASWAAPYVGYAYENGITKGISNTRFGAGDHVTEPQFLTFLLRLLGYTDGMDFTWDAPYALANEIGLLPDSLPQSTPFTRGCAVMLCWRLLDRETLDGSTLAEDLIDNGVFDANSYQAAKAIASGSDEAEEEDSETEELEFFRPGVGGTGSYGNSGNDGGSSSGGNGDTTPGGDGGSPSGGTTPGGDGGSPSGGSDSGPSSGGGNTTQDVPLG